MIDNLKHISIHNRQRIIKLIGLEKKYENLLIMKYCECLSRNEIADKLFIEPETLDKMVTKARKQFNNILMNEYHLFSNEDKQYLNLLQIED